jgi:hypothetical protein
MTEFFIFVNKSNSKIFVVSPCNLLIQMHTTGTSKNSAMKPPFKPVDSLAQLASTLPHKKKIHHIQVDADAIYLCYGHDETFQGPVYN